MRNREKGLLALIGAGIILSCLLAAPLLFSLKASTDSAWSVSSQVESAFSTSASSTSQSNAENSSDIQSLRTKTANSIGDAFSDFVDGIGEAAEGAVGAVADIPENVGQMAEDWQMEQQEAEEARIRKVLEEAVLTPSTEELEYSYKETDPLKLVKCSDSRIEVTSEGQINLSTVGVKKVKYTLSYKGQTEDRTVKFKVVDSKAPEIVLVDESPTISVGAEYDPNVNVASIKDPVDGDISRVDAQPDVRAGTDNSYIGEDTFFENGWYLLGGGVDTGTPGVYGIDVYAVDVHGNIGYRSFDVTVLAPEEPAAPVVGYYILNTNTHKFHRNGCRAIRQMYDSNRWDVEMTRDEIIGMGYTPCGICHP